MPIDAEQLKSCLEIMNRIKGHKISEMFFQPLDKMNDVLPPNYATKIVKLIDLSTICDNLQNGVYKTIKEWKSDVNIVWKNVYQIFPPEDFHYKIAKELQEMFNKLTKFKSEKKQIEWEGEMSDLDSKFKSFLTIEGISNSNSSTKEEQPHSSIISPIYIPPSTTKPYKFMKNLVEGVIEKRLYQFIIMVKYNGQSYKCHCPTTGRIGSFALEGRPCLLSPSSDSNRKTAFTVEAVSLNKPSEAHKKWIGINQNEVNRYVEHFLKEGAFSNMISESSEILREQTLGNSKLDFLIGSTYLEVKTPLQQIQLDVPDCVTVKKKSAPFSSTDRMVKHINELGNSLKNHQRAILLLCFIYDNPMFEVIEKSTNYEKVKKTVDNNLEKGVECWQANFKIGTANVDLEKYFKIQIK